ncbi:hypothetical protein OK116_06280 [Xylella fastidiosa subsp. fastidiosa]|nr:hypothetical protein [Xylella fastidiosa]UIT49156.1 hypothetical protein LZ752_06075 [Xylella fastidiosa subsp. fastidiosa]UIT51303.1 hypothetical protein LZ753_05985 [Xylella fastidiosa subsp. fastidiosa]WCF15086.1 hypothetical protein OK115_00430 [Xylella fastidiosa subsp. fastidiosa]WCF16364.1 hypothetical protein OK116_06280 [Xylella fastidiosa subsp. fastidiosa]WCF18550.1 hypothetical protein OK118_06070 [Xylella fastidiosa subsp. fastidiosa]
MNRILRKGQAFPYADQRSPPQRPYPSHHRQKNSEELMNTAAPEARTKYEAEFDLAYHVRLYERHIRFYCRLRKLFVFSSVLAGTVAIGNVVSGLPWLVSLLSVVVAVAGLADLVFDLSNQTVAYEHQRRKCVELQVEQSVLTLEELDSQMRKILIDAPPEIEALRMPSYNDVLRTLGHVARVQPLTRVERVLDKIA